MARAVVELVDTAGPLVGLAGVDQPIAEAQRDLRQPRRALVVRMLVVRPEREGDIGRDVGDLLGHQARGGLGDVELHLGEVEEPHLDAVLLAEAHRALHQLALAALHGLPVPVVADERQHDDAVVLAKGLEQQARDAEDAVVVVRADAEDGCQRMSLLKPPGSYAGACYSFGLSIPLRGFPMASRIRSGLVSWCVVALAGLAWAVPRDSGAQSPAPLRHQLSRQRRPHLQRRRRPWRSSSRSCSPSGRFKEAIPLAEQLVANAERTQGAAHADVADALAVLSDAESGAGLTARAVGSLERAIAIRERASGPDDPGVAQDCNALAVLHFGQGNYKAAEPLMTRALAIRERALGPEAPETAQSVNNLAQLYQEMGDYTAAEPLLQRALALYEKAHGPTHADVAIALNNLASLYSAKGDYPRAEPLYRRTLAIREQNDGADSMPAAQVLNNLGLMYQRQGALDKARPLLERSLAIREQKLGAEHIDVARVLNNLAIVHQEQAELDVAERLYTRALAIYEKTLGPNHPLVGQTVNNLAAVYLAKRDFARAEPLFERAVSTRRATLGPQHPDMNRALTSQAIFFDLTNRLGDALRLQTEATEVGEHNLALVLATGSESQKLRYMETFAEGTDITVSLHRRSAPNDESATRLALTTVLRRKGRVLDAMSTSLQAVRERLAPEGKAALDELADVRGQLATPRSARPGSVLRWPSSKRPWPRSRARAQDLEVTLSRQSREYRAQAQAVTIAAVQAALPSDAALVEFIAYRPFDPLAVKRDARFTATRVRGVCARVNRRPGVARHRRCRHDRRRCRPSAPRPSQSERCPRRTCRPGARRAVDGARPRAAGHPHTCVPVTRRRAQPRAVCRAGRRAPTLSRRPLHVLLPYERP